MKKIVVIGLGNFGFNIAQTLTANKCEVLGIDINPDTVNKSKDFISYAVTADASNKEAIEALNINDFDAAVVSIGQDMASSILISLYLKEIGISRVVARAISEDHAKVLSHIGISDIIFPEKDIAVKIANKLSYKNAIDYLPISDEYNIVEVATPTSFIDKSLAELKISSKYSCQIIGIKYLKEEIKSNLENATFTTIIAPSAQAVLNENSIMIVLGKFADIEKLQSEQ